MKQRKTMPFKIGLSIVIISCFVLIGFYVMLIGSFAEEKPFEEQFILKKESFEKIKNRLLKLQKEYSASYVGLIITYPYKDSEFLIGEIQSEHPMKIHTRINVTKEEIEWIDDISEACEPGTLTRIVYENQRVTIGTDGNQYAFVYTVDGKKPTYMSAPNEYWKWRRRKFGSGWYFFTTM